MELRPTELTALLIAPDRELAQQFTATLPETRAFQILADSKTYPPEQTLDIRLRQLNPDVVLLDVASNLDQACEIIRFVASVRPPVHVICLHRSNDSEAILRTLRQGGTEFLHAPFEVAGQREAITRVRRLRQPESSSRPEAGKVLVFTSAKPGSGATTLAAQTAFAIQKHAGQRVLLADFDLTGGSVGFYLKVSHGYSLLDVVDHAQQMDPALWGSLTVHYQGVDVLPAPETPHQEPIEQSTLHDVIEYMRLLYDWVVIDLPVVFHQISLLSLSESDEAFLVSTSELPSLHLARKAVNLLGQLGIGKDRFRIIVNRVNRKDGITSSDMEKIFNSPVHASLPNDYFSLHRVVTLGQPLGPDSELGRAVEALAVRLAGAPAAERRRPSGLLEAKPVLSQT